MNPKPIIQPPSRNARKDPVVDYLVANYSGHPTVPRLAKEIKKLMDDGVNVTPAMVDDIYAKAQKEWIKTRREVESQDRADRKARGLSGYTYFLHHSGAVKIGYSRNPRERARALSLRESYIIGVVPSLPRFETLCHERWRHLQIMDTEWFLASDELLEWISAIAEKWHYKRHCRNQSTDISHNYERLLHSIFKTP